MKEYSKIIHESKNSYLEEGVWSTFLKWIEPSAPKHPKWKALDDRFWRAMRRCDDMYPPKTKKVQVGGQVKDYGLDVSYDEYEENPERIRCRAEAKLAIYKEFLKFYKKEGVEGVCKFNRNKERCMREAEKDIEILKNAIPDLEREVKQMGRKKMSRAQFAKFKRLVS